MQNLINLIKCKVFSVGPGMDNLINITTIFVAIYC